MERLRIGNDGTIWKDENGNVTMIHQEPVIKVTNFEGGQMGTTPLTRKLEVISNAMKTLKIEIPDGYEIDTEKSTFEQIVFKEIKKELPKSWEELEDASGYYPNSSAPIFSKNTKKYKLYFKTKEQAQASIALAKLSQLREVYRQGWKPESNAGVKYSIRKIEQKLEIINYYEIRYFLSFQSEEIAEEFLNNFKDLIEEASPLLFGE